MAGERKYAKLGTVLRESLTKFSMLSVAAASLNADFESFFVEGAVATFPTFPLIRHGIEPF
jgi:hypothetical protein